MRYIEYCTRLATILPVLAEGAGLIAVVWVAVCRVISWRAANTLVGAYG